MHSSLDRFTINRRIEEVELLSKYFSEEECVAIIGPPGIGKTHLAKSFVSYHEEINSATYYPRYNKEAHLDEEITEELDQLKKDDIFVLEEAEILSEQSVASVRELCRNKGIFLVVVSRDDLPLAGSMPVIEVSGVKDSELISVLERANNGALPVVYLEKALSFIGGHPLKLNYLAKLIESHGVESAVQILERELRASYLSSYSTSDIKAFQSIIVDTTDYIIEEINACPSKIYDIKSREFEKLVSRLLQDQGWETELTKETRDGGKDILAFRDNGVNQHLCLVETKKYRKDRPVGIALVRELWGTLCDEQATSAMLVTTSYFSPEAIEFEKKYKYRMALNDFGRVMEWVSKYKT